MSSKFVDPVVAEVHAIRASMLEETGGDIAELMRQVVNHQQQSDRQIIREPFRKRTEQTDARERENVRRDG